MILTDIEIKSMYMETYSKTFIEFARDIEQAVLDKLQDKLKNAERYEWLIDVGNTWEVYYMIGDGLCTEELDKTIDYALRERLVDNVNVTHEKN